MTTEEAAQLLAMAVSFDPRITPPTQTDAVLKAQAWAAALDTRITLAHGKQAVIDHYAASRDVIMPADINRICKQYRLTEIAEREAENKMLEAAPRGIPMPDHVRQLFTSLLQGTELP